MTAVLEQAAHVAQIMGLPFSVHVRGAGARSGRTRVLVEEVFADLRVIDRMFSTYDPGSQISRLDAGRLRLADADPLVHEVLELAEEARRLTGGLFDVHLPDAGGRRRLDPSGLVKGWAAERAFGRLADLGPVDLCLNAGGDVVVGTAGGGPPWRVGIERPDGGSLAGDLPLADGAVATSGTGARGAHLIDPRDGTRPSGLRSVTVVGPSLLWADVLATAAFVRGEDAVAWVRGHAGYEAAMIPPANAQQSGAGSRDM